MANLSKKIKGIDYLFVAILLIAIILRFWKLADYFQFGVDEEYQALFGWSIVKHFHVLWIGVSASNIGYYLGPGLVYLSALLLWLNKDPIIFGYFASFIGIITALSLYYIAFKLYNKRVATVSFVLYIFSPFAFYYDRKYWPLAVPLIALWLFYSLVKSFKNSGWLLVTALLMGLSYHIHISLWIFWPFILFAFFYLALKKKLSLFKISASISIFVLTTLPLLVFDFIHNFDNLRLPLRLLTRKQQVTNHSINQLIEFFTVFKKIFLHPSFSNNLIDCVLVILLIISLIWLSWRKEKSIRFLLSIIFLFFLGFILFPSPMQEYYFVLPLPFIILIVAKILDRIKPFGYIVLILFMVANLYGFIKQPVYSDYPNKIEIIKQVKKTVSNQSFYLEIDGNYLFNGGWRYLFQAYHLSPDQSSADQIFGWIYLDEISKERPKYKVTISRNNNLKFSSSVIKKFTSGAYTAYLIYND